MLCASTRRTAASERERPHPAGPRRAPRRRSRVVVSAASRLGLRGPSVRRDDDRALGLPVVSLAWTREDSRDEPRGRASRGRDGARGAAHLTDHRNRRLWRKPISRSTRREAPVRRGTRRAALQPLMRDRSATVSRESAMSAMTTSASVTTVRSAARLLRTPQRRMRKPRAQPPDWRARFERCPLVAERMWIATAPGAATVVHPSELESEREVEIRAVERETLVEPARLHPGRPAIGIGSPAGRHEEWSVGCRILDRAPGQPDEGRQGHVEREPDAVDRPFVGAHGQRRDGADALVVERRGHVLEEVRLGRTCRCSAGRSRLRCRQPPRGSSRLRSPDHRRP